MITLHVYLWITYQIHNGVRQTDKGNEYSDTYNSHISTYATTSVAAIIPGPIILLELCEQSLKDWLKKLEKITDEAEDNMINFCTDVARGMSHLHENGVSPCLFCFHLTNYFRLKMAIKSHEGSDTDVKLLPRSNVLSANVIHRSSTGYVSTEADYRLFLWFRSKSVTSLYRLNAMLTRMELLIPSKCKQTCYKASKTGKRWCNSMQRWKHLAIAGEYYH